MKVTAETIYADVEKIRERAPLVHNITNYVVMNTTANALLALGASPVMAHAEEEVEYMTGIAGALVINIGTLSRSWIAAMFRAASQAVELGVPLVFDPVGAGATAYRTKTCLDLIDTYSPAVIRGNASEIMALVSQGVKTRGVDSADPSAAALDAARVLNGNTGSTVCISGEIDYIVDKEGVIIIENGHPMMPRVTGLGCTASALCGAFAAVNRSFAASTAGAMAVMGICGEMAAEVSKGPGTLQVNFIDRLFGLSGQDIKNRIKIGRGV